MITASKTWDLGEAVKIGKLAVEGALLVDLQVKVPHLTHSSMLRLNDIEMPHLSK
jgi:hypothetical protein